MDQTLRANEPIRSFRAAGLLRRRALLLLAAGIVGIAGLWFGWSWWTVGRFLESTDDAYIGGEVTPLAPEVSGFIAEIAVADNQFVKAGTLLVKLDDRDYRAALARAEANVAAQEATLANLDPTRRLQLAIIDENAAELGATAAEVTRTKEDVERYRALIITAASVQRFQQAEADYQKAIAADEKARAALSAERNRLDVIATQKQETDAALAEAKAQRDTARLNLGYTEIRAPIDGIVGNRSARLGAYATEGTQLLSIVPTQGLWIDANFKESQLGDMREGQRADITADALPGEIFHGHVASLAPATGAEFSILPPENATGNFTKIVQRVPVRILLDDVTDASTLLRPGLSVSVDIDTRSVSDLAEARQ